ncbi:hypothetical protein FA15DRAFT_716748 [Coprinopsis marcescibilis]|uniref:Protein kinase domain-containing protein n=1 Tax=Coprinopsis marcescibilis TaxID=230819 RepID=A0A5C3L6B3_COPMA|nr:hypothetical protein FA15DRAFT_716748 [Coprinopsis marcescibilis]
MSSRKPTNMGEIEGIQTHSNSVFATYFLTFAPTDATSNPVTRHIPQATPTTPESHPRASVHRETPRHSVPDFDLKPQNGSQSYLVAECMDAEMVCCHWSDFKRHYLPFHAKLLDVDGCLEYLTQGPKPVLKLRGNEPLGSKQYHWTNLLDLPSRMRKTEGEVYKHLEEMFTSIRAYQLKRSYHRIPNKDREASLFEFRNVPHTNLSSWVPGVNQRAAETCFTADREGEMSPLDQTMTTAPDVKLTYETRQENRIQLLGDVSRLMSSDPRRMFCYAFTVEDDLITLWYFSKSHSVKAGSFSFINSPREFVAAMLPLCFATDEELGFDPKVVRLKGNSFLYHFPQEDGSDTYFKTLEALAEPRTLRLSSRATRIWKVVQVESPRNLKPLGQEMVLKDVWLKDDADTEKQIQNNLFEDIEAFARLPNRGDHPCLTYCRQQDKLALNHWLDNENYKSLFLSVSHEYIGPFSKEKVPEAWQQQGLFKIPKGRHGTDPCTTVSSGVDELETIPCDDSYWGTVEMEERNCGVAKKQCRFVFKEVCTSVHRLTKLGDAIAMLAQCVVALQVMFCAGWVHRDISSGNILAFRSTPDDPWCVKLADLEYAKRFSSDCARSDPKIGTPYFMPHEILAERLLHNPLMEMYANSGSIGAISDSDEEDFAELEEPNSEGREVWGAIKHNWQHDLESLWWILLYLITARIPHQPSRDWALQVFRNSHRLSRTREQVFTLKIYTTLSPSRVHEPLRPVMKYLEYLRDKMCEYYLRREREGQLDDPATYSGAYSMFINAFYKLLKTEGWQNINIDTLELEAQVIAIKKMPFDERKRERTDDNSRSDDRGGKSSRTTSNSVESCTKSAQLNVGSNKKARRR